MTPFMLAAHVLAVILTIGPTAIASSMFPRVAGDLERARAADDEPGVQRALIAARLLHRITRIYAVIALSVPAFGLVVALQWGMLLQPWLLLSIALTAVAAALIGFGVLPVQRRTIADDAAPPSRARSAMLAGLYNLCWVVVAVFMVTKPAIGGW